MSDDLKETKLPDLPPLNEPSGAFGSGLGPALSGTGPALSGSRSLTGLMSGGLGFDWRMVAKKFGRGAAWVAALFVIFVISAWVSLPTRAIAWRISHEARKAGFIVNVDDLSVRPWGSATLENVVWNFKPSRPDSTPVPFVIEELDVSFSVLKYLLLDTIDVEFEGKMDEGSIAGAYYKSGDESQIKFEIADLPLYGVPKLQEAVNAPVRGIFALNVDITAPDNEWAKSTGRLEVHCYSCTVGDGETKLYVPGSKKASMLSKGVTIPEIDLGTLDGVLEIADGKAVAEEFGTESNDIVFRISGDIEFDDPIGNSRLNLLIKVFIDPSLRKRSDQVDLLVLTANPKVLMDPPDEGWMGVVLEGNFKNRRFRGIKSKSRQEALREKRESSRAAAKQRAEQRAQQRAAQKAKQEEAAKAAEEAKAADEAGGEGEEAGEAAAGTAEAAVDPSGHAPIPQEAGVIIEEVPPQEQPVEEQPVEQPVVEEQPAAEQPSGDGQTAAEAEQFPQ